jgi:transcriptional regulator with XRE-family HTH domain
MAKGSRESGGGTAVEKWGTAVGARKAEVLDRDAEELFEHFVDATERSAVVQRLTEARSILGATQKFVAKRMGTTQSAVSELEGGATDPRLSTLQRYARAIGCHLRTSLICPYSDHIVVNGFQNQIGYSVPATLNAWNTSSSADVTNWYVEIVQDQPTDLEWTSRPALIS